MLHCIPAWHSAAPRSTVIQHAASSGCIKNDVKCRTVPQHNAPHLVWVLFVQQNRNLFHYESEASFHQSVMTLMLILWQDDRPPKLFFFVLYNGLAVA